MNAYSYCCLCHMQVAAFILLLMRIKNYGFASSVAAYQVPKAVGSALIKIP